jgi:hypothetical protein
MPDRELHVLMLVAERLRLGLKQYGPLTRGKKDWRKEASEEAFDMAVYLACELTDKED